MPLRHHKLTKFKTKGRMFPLHNPLMDPNSLRTPCNGLQRLWDLGHSYLLSFSSISLPPTAVICTISSV